MSMCKSDKLTAMLDNLLAKMYCKLESDVYFYKTDVRSDVLGALSFITVVCREEKILQRPYIEEEKVDKLIKDIDKLIVDVLTEMSKMNPDSVFLSTYITKEFYIDVIERIEVIRETYRGKSDV